MIDLIFSMALIIQDVADTPVSDESAEPVEVVADSFDAAAALDAINTSLNALDTLQARFTQVSPDGSAVQGQLSLRRPGRLRFEYDAPSPLLIIAGGGTVAIRDTALETTNRAPIRATPLWWLLKDEVDLATDARVIDIWSEHGFVYISLTDAEGEMDGEAVFLFDAETFSLSQWFAVDSLGQTTRVLLDEVETGQRLDPRLFVLDDDDNERPNRRR